MCKKYRVDSLCSSVKLIRRKVTRNLVLPPRRQHVIIVDTFFSDVIFIRERWQDFSSLGNISTELFTGKRISARFTEGDSPQMTGRSKFHPAAREQISFVSRNFPWYYLFGEKTLRKSFAPFHATIFIYYYSPEKYSKFWNLWKWEIFLPITLVINRHKFYLEFLPFYEYETFFPSLKKKIVRWLNLRICLVDSSLRQRISEEITELQKFS